MSLQIGTLDSYDRLFKHVPWSLQVEKAASDHKEFEGQLKYVQSLVKSGGPTGKTILCPVVWKKGVCTDDKCTLAHSIAVLYSLNLANNPFYKSSKCKESCIWKNGCKRLHSGELGCKKFVYYNRFYPYFTKGDIPPARVEVPASHKPVASPPVREYICKTKLNWGLIPENQDPKGPNTGHAVYVLPAPLTPL